MGRDFRKIKVWQLADDLTVQVYNLTKAFPKNEMYGVTSQLRRAVSSVPANIAEGAARAHKKEYIQFLNIARGSLAETDYFLHLSRRLDYLDQDAYDKLTITLNQVASSLYGLTEAVKKEI